MTTSRNRIRKRWKPSAADLEMMRRHYPTTKTEILARLFDVAYHQVHRLAGRLGLRKDPEWLAGPESGRLDGKLGMGTRFKPGNQPWTQGRKGIRQSPRTEFKPGSRPWNYAPVGSFRVSKDGYLQIKLTDTGYPPKDWVMYHRHVWQQAHGPIPDGYIVAFLPGRFSSEADEITPDRLELVCRREWMLRHTFHQYGPEIASAVQLRGAITRQINKRAKETA